MKSTFSTKQELIARAVLSLSGTAFAADHHVGGHGDEETAIGKPGGATRLNRTITVEMGDNMRHTLVDI